MTYQDYELASFLRTEVKVRKANDDGIWELLEEAADEIERLRALLVLYRGAIDTILTAAKAARDASDEQRLSE